MQRNNYSGFSLYGFHTWFDNAIFCVKPKTYGRDREPSPLPLHHFELSRVKPMTHKIETLSLPSLSSVINRIWVWTGLLSIRIMWNIGSLFQWPGSPKGGQHYKNVLSVLQVGANWRSAVRKCGNKHHSLILFKRGEKNIPLFVCKFQINQNLQIRFPVMTILISNPKRQ